MLSRFRRDLRVKILALPFLTGKPKPQPRISRIYADWNKKIGENP